MNVLVVYTHPNHESLNGAFLERTLKGLGENPNHPETRVIDLYAEGFNPTLVFNADKRRRDMHLDPEMTKYRDAFLWATDIVFIYPIWWGRPPAMLFGFFDRLLATDFAYRYHPGKLLPEGLLAGRRAVCVSTMKGPDGYLGLFLGNAHRLLMQRAVFSFVGIKKAKFFEFGSMEKKSGKQEKRLALVERWFRTFK